MRHSQTNKERSTLEEVEIHLATKHLATHTHTIKIGAYSHIDTDTVQQLRKGVPNWQSFSQFLESRCTNLDVI